MTENYQNRSVVIYLGFLNQTDGTFIDTPEVVWEGRMNQMSLNLAKGVADIKLTCEYRLRREPRIGRFTGRGSEDYLSRTINFSILSMQFPALFPNGEIVTHPMVVAACLVLTAAGVALADNRLKNEARRLAR
jgi:hypothetical protein